MRATALSAFLLVAACGGGDGESDANGGDDIDAAGPGGDDAAPVDASAPDAAPPRPDLVLDEAFTAAEWSIDEQNFVVGSCSLAEGCIGALGTRTLLRFPVRMANQGEVDLVLGDPAENSLYEYGACHAHWHLEEFWHYQLLDGDGNPVASTRRHEFCVFDSEMFDGEASPTPVYDCGLQGISVGWASTSQDNLPCQWIDITGVPAGDYVLRVTVNDSQAVTESDLGNNEIEVPVAISP